MRSDLINIANIMDVRATEASAMATYLRTATLTLNNKLSATPVSGQDYLVRIKYSIGSIDNQYLKYGAVHAYNGMTAQKFYEEMAASLNKNFAREAEPAFTFAGSDSGLVITEVEPKWVLGTYPQRPIEFEVSVDTIVTENGEEGPWCEKVVYGTSNVPRIGGNREIPAYFFCL